MDEGVTDATGTIYTSILYQNENLENILSQALNTLPGLRILVTEDSDICDSNDFENAKQEFYNDPNDFDVWAHVMTLDSTVQHLLIKFDKYVVLSSNSEENPTLQGN